MLLIRGSAGGTALTGTLYEPDEDPPTFRGAPDDDAPYVWVCDAFYEVESGGQLQRVNGDEKRIAFESPMPRGFEDRDRAIEAAKHTSERSSPGSAFRKLTSISASRSPTTSRPELSRRI